MRFRAVLTLALLLAAPIVRAQQPGCDLTVYEHPNYRGESLRLRQDVPTVEERWNDRISSVTITAGTWEFFEHAEYRGEHLRLRPGRYATMVDRWDDVVSSLRCVAPGG
jgi:hypothetical protein